MKILELTIRNFRGIVDMSNVKLDGENIVVYGRNGVGKSAIADAIDFLFTGEITRLTGEGTQDVSTKKHGPHVGKAPEESYVHAKIRSIDGTEFEVRRVVGNAESVEVSDEYRTLFEKMELYAKNGAHFLSRRELLRYIVAPPTKRAEQVQMLLDIPDVKKKNDYLLKAVKEAKRRRDEYQVKYNTISRDIVSLCGNVEGIDAVNTWRKILGANELQELAEKNILDGVTYAGKTSDVEKVNAIQKYNKIITVLVDLQEKIALMDSRVKKIVSEIIESAISTSEMKKIGLITNGLELLDGSGKCPLCDAQWSDEKTLKEFLVNRKANSENASRLNADYHRDLVQLVSYIREFLDVLELVENEETKEECSRLKKAQEDGKKYVPLTENIEWAQYTERSTSIIVWINSMDCISIIEECKEAIKKIEQSIDTDGKQKAEAWDKLNEYKRLYEQHESVSELVFYAQKLFDKVSDIQKKYNVSQTEVLNKLYDEIKERFVEIYIKLHGDDESNFQANMERTKNGIGLSVDFHEQGQFPPAAYHSEGHQDSMGIALFFALMEHLSGEEKGLIVLDDVVMSVDIEHRLHFCDLLRDEYPDFQFIITTHDEVWEKYLEKHGVVKKKNAFKFINWTVETGPITTSIGDVWDECAKKAESDLNSAAHYLRRGMEDYFAEVCDLLGAKVIYNSEHRWDFGQYYDASVSKLKELYKQAKAVANQYGNDEARQKLEKMEELLSQAYTDVTCNNWVTNKLIHKNDEDFSRAEFDSAVMSMKKVCSCFECSICKAKYKVAYEEGHKPSVIKCKCGAHMFSLVKK